MSHAITADQRTDEWYAARLGRATASRFIDVLARTKTGEGAGRKNYRSELMIERLTGTQVDMYQNAAMQWGTDTEELAKSAYMLKTGNIVDDCGFYIHDTLMAGASPDGLVGKDGGIEIKCPNSANHAETLRSGKIPKKYIPQVQGQMWIAELEWVDFISFDPRLPSQAQIFIQRIKRDNDFIAMLEEEMTRFLSEVDEEVDFIKNYKSPEKKVR